MNLPPQRGEGEGTLGLKEWSCRGFNRTPVDTPPIFQLSQSEALQSVTASQSLKLEKCFVTITSII